MATQSTVIIGTGGAYPDFASWVATLPSKNLVTQDAQFTIKLKNQVHAPIDAFTGWTTSATCYLHITADDGASVFDRGDLATLPLRYDKTKGATIEGSAGYTLVLNCAQYTRVSRLQIASTATSSVSSIQVVKLVDNCVVDRCIIDGFSADAGDNTNFVLQAAFATIQNSLILQRGVATTSYIALLAYGAKMYNCGLVAPVAKLAVGIKTLGSASTLTNCYLMNVTATDDAAFVPTKVKCYTDATSTGWTTVPYSAATFTSVATDGTHDYRLPAGSALIDQGNTVTQGATSLNGVTRATYDIGPWEYVAAGGGDTQAPTLSIPTATATGSTSASGTVATDEAGGLLYFTASANATETAATVKTGQSISVTATGSQSVTFSGLAAGTTYYAHYVQVDAAGNTSAVANSSSFTTTAVDNTAPTWQSTVFGTVTTTQTTAQIVCPAATDANGIKKYQYSLNGGTTWLDNGTGTTVTISSGLSAGQTYQLSWRALDPSDNASSVLSQGFTTQAAPTTGSFKTRQFANNTGTAWASGTAVAWQWHAATRIGTQAASITYGSGTLASDGTLTAAGLPVGSGYLLAAILGTDISTDKPFYQSGTVT